MTIVVRLFLLVSFTCVVTRILADSPSSGDSESNDDNNNSEESYRNTMGTNNNSPTSGNQAYAKVPTYKPASPYRASSGSGYVNNNKNNNNNNNNDYQPSKYEEDNNKKDYQPPSKYEQKQEPYGKPKNYKPHTLAQPISQASQPQTLNDLYLPPNAKPYQVKYTASGPYGQKTPVKIINPRQQIITNVQFAKDFTEIDPYNNQSSWMFRTSRTATANYTADHATFVVNHKDYTVDMVAIPLQKWLPSSLGPIASTANNEVAISPKQNVMVGPNEKVLMRLWFSCKTVNIGDFPEPANLVMRAWNDPRMGACAFALSDLPNTGIKFRVVATNEGVWASYTREPFARAVQNATFRAFDVFRQIAVRKRYDDWIDAAIQYDRMEGTATWFINGIKVWKVGSLGTLPANDGYNRVLIDTGAQDAEMIGVPQQVITQIAIFTLFHGVDPNNLNLGVNNNLALIRLVNTTDFYGPNMRFWDNNSIRENKLYGQGVSMTLKRLVVIKSDSLPVVTAGNNNNNGANSYGNNDNIGSYQQQDTSSYGKQQEPSPYEKSENSYRS